MARKKMNGAQRHCNTYEQKTVANPMSFFSIVIPLYNKEAYILQTLQSVCKQSFSDFEILLINDGSTDRSLEEVAKVKDIRLKIITQKNQGVSRARNFGMQQAKGNFIALLDADDLWAPNYLEKIHALTKEFPKEAVFSSAVHISKKGLTKKAVYSISDKPVQKLNYFKGSLKSSLLHPSSVVLHRDVFIKLGGFDTRYSNYEDIDYWFRIGLHYEVVFASTPYATIQKIENSLSSQKFNWKTHCFLESYDTVKSEVHEFGKVLDLNRLSLALLCKQNGCEKQFELLKKKIHAKNLNLPQRLLLRLPKVALSTLRKVKAFFEEKGVSIVVFK
jgi:glycosyltransferase involved in cell wall biosynthesis